VEITIAASVRAALEAEGRNLIGNLAVERVVQSLPRATAHHITVGPASTVQVNVGSVASIRLIYLEADGALLVRTDASDGSPQAVAPPESGAKGVFLKTGTATGVWIENAGAQAVQASLIVAGLEA